MLQSIQIANDPRITIQLSCDLPYYFQPNDTIYATITFNPSQSVDPINTNITLVFQCDNITINVLGKIAAPGLVAEDAHFGEVRKFEVRTMTRKVVNAGNIDILLQDLINENSVPCFEYITSKP